MLSFLRHSILFETDIAQRVAHTEMLVKLLENTLQLLADLTVGLHFFSKLMIHRELCIRECLSSCWNIPEMCISGFDVECESHMIF